MKTSGIASRRLQSVPVLSEVFMLLVPALLLASALSCTAAVTGDPEHYDDRSHHDKTVHSEHYDDQSHHDHTAHREHYDDQNHHDHTAHREHYDDQSHHDHTAHREHYDDQSHHDHTAHREHYDDHSHHDQSAPSEHCDVHSHHDQHVHPERQLDGNDTTRMNDSGIQINEESRPKWKADLDFATTVILTANTINLMLGMGCATYWREVVSHTWPPTGIVIGMFGQFILLPACGSLLSWLFRLTSYEALGVLMVSCSPGGSFSNFFTYWCDGDLALSIVMTTFSSMLAFVGMPFNLWLYSKIWMATQATPFVIPYSSIMTALVFITMPVAVGMVIRHFHIGAARVITKIASVCGWLGCLAVMIIWLILYWRVFVEATPLLYLSAFLLPVLGFAMAYVFAMITCRTHKVCRTIGIETGSQNMVVALSIILLSFKDPVVKGSMLLFPTLYGITLLLEMFLGIGAFQTWKKHCSKEMEDDEVFHPPAYRATIERGSYAETKELRK